MRTLLLSLLFVFAAHSAEYTLPADISTTWVYGTDVGVTGGIWQYLPGGASERTHTGTADTDEIRTTISGDHINVVNAPYNVDNTGATNVKTSLQNAIDDCGTGQVLYMPAGTYRIESQINIERDSITIRGDGPGQTIIRIVGSDITGINFVGLGVISGTDAQTVTGTKTKGTETLTVASSAGYTVGELVSLFVANEEDNTRIEAGEVATWTPYGYRDLRTVLCRVTAKPSGTTITIDPPLLFDCTNHATRIERDVTAGAYLLNVGIEDLSLSFDSALSPQRGIKWDNAVESWIYNVHCTDWERPSNSGAVVYVGNSFRSEVRYCKFVCSDPANSGDDGAIQRTSSTSCLTEDNILVDFNTGTMDSGKSFNNAFTYNYIVAGKPLQHHNGHSSHDLYEGNVTEGLFQVDGYHASGSHFTMFRSWHHGTVVLNRFTRRVALVGNVFGKDGTTDANYSFGNPNIGNGNAWGFAGPTGNSLQAGSFDYIQWDPIGGFTGEYEYEILPGDIAAGDFWADWQVTGTLTTRTSDTVGVFSVSGGNWRTGSIPPASSSLAVRAYWNNYANSMSGGTVTAVSGTDVTISFTTGTLPATSTVLNLWPGQAGFQERDLDIEPSLERKHNYESLAVGTGAVTDSISPDTLPNSLAYAAEPSWWGDDGFTGTWPPVDPENPTFSIGIIPAGARYLGATAPGTLTTGTLTIGP